MHQEIKTVILNDPWLLPLARTGRILRVTPMVELRTGYWAPARRRQHARGSPRSQQPSGSTAPSVRSLKRYAACSLVSVS
jgi:hypothetical protein